MNEFKLQLLLTARDQLSAVAGKAGQAIEILEKRFKGLREAAEKIGSAGGKVAMAGAGALAISGATVKAFSDLESAQARLENATGTFYGQSEHLAALKSLVIDLGNRYPGNTKEFTMLAESMLKAGMGADVLVNGALKGAGALKVMFDLNPEDAGKQYVAMGNAMGIAGRDATQFADVLQRLNIASGLGLQEIATAMPYMGEKLKLLKVQGLDAAKELAAVMGALKQNGVEGSMIGTTFEQFLARTAMIDPRSRHIRGGLNQEAFGMLQSRGIKMQFFDGQGQFVGLYRAIGELQKLGRLAQNEKLLILHQIFGETGARMAAVDLGAVNAMAQRMLVQENIQKRLDRITQTLSGRWEAATGTFTNLMATIGERMAPVLGPLLDKVNALLTRWQEWSEAHPRLVGWLGVLAASLGTLMVVGGGTVWLGAKMVVAFTQLGPALAGLRILISGCIPIVWGLTSSLWGMAAAFMATPVGWICAAIAAIIAIGVLLWKNWDRIIGWFKAHMPALGDSLGNLGTAIKSAFQGLWQALNALWSTVKAAYSALWQAIQPVVQLLGRLWNILKPFLGGALKILGGIIIGVLVAGFLLLAGAVLAVVHVVTLLVKGIAWLIEKGRVAISFVWDMGKAFFSAGANIATSIAKGIWSAVSHPVDAIKKVVEKIRRFLPFSPAKEGPLSDIHKLRLTETIAESISANPLVDKMRVITGAVRSAAPQALAAGMAFGAVGSVGMGGRSGQPTIIIQVDARGAAPGVERDIERAILKAAPALRRELDRLDERAKRGRF